MNAAELAHWLRTTIYRLVAEAETVTEYRQPLVGLAAADDPRFAELRRTVHPTHMLPQELLPGASSVVSFFLPFAPWVVEANARERKAVAREWAVAYVETNALIGTITEHLIKALGEQGIRAAAEPATHNFDPVSLVSRWSHKSVAIIAGLGSLGLHQMVITDAGCAGRFGSLVLDAELPVEPPAPRERCLYFHDGSCLECVQRCPAGALDPSEPLDKQACYRRLLQIAREYEDLGLADACGKCAIGPCSFESAVKPGVTHFKCVAPVKMENFVNVTVNYGTDERTVAVEPDTLLGEAIIATGLPLEQPCAGRGSCLKCKVIAQGALSPLDEKEREGLTEAERAADYRLACRAQVMGDVSVTLAPIVVYSNKMFRACDDYKQPDRPLGLAVDLGSTTVAAFVTTLDQGKVCAGAAALNQQTAFGADVISRLAAAQRGPETARRLSMLALSSIVQAVDALKLPRRVKERIVKVTIVGNCAMHHLLLRLPVDTLAELPFQPHHTASVRDNRELWGDTFPANAEVALPPLIGGFVGSDALACLVYYGFDRAPGPMAAIDLGTNGEVMVTDGLPPVGSGRILVASTAAGPAFEGVNISCGSRAVDGAIVKVKADPAAGSFHLETIADQPPVGLTGSGLLDLINELRRVGVVERNGRLTKEHPTFGQRLSVDERGVRRLLLTDQAVDLRGAESPADATPISLYLTQHDIRELQKAKGAIRAATEILMGRLGLGPGDLQRMILTGSFGSQLNVEAVVGLGMIPPVALDRVEPSANGAGFGAALMLDDDEFARAERIAAAAEQVDLDQDADFIARYIESMDLPGGQPA